MCIAGQAEMSNEIGRLNIQSIKVDNESQLSHVSRIYQFLKYFL